LLRNALVDLFGDAVAINVLSFVRSLAAARLIPEFADQAVHFPLLDWHWDVFGPNDSFEVAPNLFVVGDASGKARGLLQACVSGLLGADECETSLK
jgi:hypothetical protein